MNTDNTGIQIPEPPGSTQGEQRESVERPRSLSIPRDMEKMIRIFEATRPKSGRHAKKS